MPQESEPPFISRRPGPAGFDAAVRQALGPGDQSQSEELACAFDRASPAPARKKACAKAFLLALDRGQIALAASLAPHCDPGSLRARLAGLRARAARRGDAKSLALIICLFFAPGARAPYGSPAPRNFDWLCSLTLDQALAKIIDSCPLDELALALRSPMSLAPACLLEALASRSGTFCESQTARAALLCQAGAEPRLCPSMAKLAARCASAFAGPFEKELHWWLCARNAAIESRLDLDASCAPAPAAGACSSAKPL